MFKATTTGLDYSHPVERQVTRCHLGMPMRVVTFKCDEDLLERLDIYARLRGITRSEAIRRAIEKLLREEQPELSMKPKVIRILG